MIDISSADTSLVSTLAIDDILFESNCYTPDPTRNCSADEMKCPKTNICMNRYTLCDGVNDCGDKWDETADNCRKLSLNKCSFESTDANNQCFWIQELDSGTTQWQTITAQTASTSKYMVRMTGPN